MTDRIAVTLELDAVTLVLLQATATHLGKSRADTIADALRLLFVAIPRPDDGDRVPYDPDARRERARAALAKAGRP
jgi:hypothetical protein